MTYGSIIRETREKLQVFQRDLANENLSRNLISNIEKGRVNLMPAKAMALFRRLLEIAWEKEIYCDLAFDDLLSDKEEYIQLKKANDLCRQLHELLNEGTFDQTIVDEAIDFAQKYDVGLLRYHIYIFSARLLKGKANNDVICKIYFDALDYLKWIKPEVIYKLYGRCLKECKGIAYTCGEFKALSLYFEILKDIHIALDIPVKPEIIYNLSLFNLKAGVFEAAYVYIEEYLQFEMDYLERIDGRILKCGIVIAMGDSVKGLNEYIQLTEELDDDKHKYQISLCLSNVLHVIAHNKMENYQEHLRESISRLLSLIEDSSDVIKSRGRMFSNIALGYSFVGNDHDASIFYRKSIEVFIEDANWLEVLKVLIDAYETFDRLSNLDYLIETVVLIEPSRIPKSWVEAHYKFLLKLQCRLNDAVAKGQNLEQLYDYIKSRIL